MVNKNELSKTYSVVPLMLCQKLNFFLSCLVQALILKPGFLPADENVCDWFLQSGIKLEVSTCAGAFLCTLFGTVLLRMINLLIFDENIHALP